MGVGRGMHMSSSGQFVPLEVGEHLCKDLGDPGKCSKMEGVGTKDSEAASAEQRQFS